MDQAIKAQWLADLRSGDFKQGHRQLTGEGDDGRFHCCLGVLCEQAVNAGIISRDGNYYEGAADVPPSEVVGWAGLREANPRVYIDARAWSLAELNDGSRTASREPFTFAQIADLIETQL